ncbi:MAG TPA: TAXI family TRAP transporter solute-binding subunit [Hyphomicrobiaceae bacterium]|nr:TAXI family TRAP transporter solute-binding subunit [Hyphomicrobiaceae bacterium]
MIASVFTRLGIAAVLIVSTFPVLAQGPSEPIVLAQARQKAKEIPVPKKALPIPDKPVGETESDTRARINNWTVGLAGGLLEGTFVQYAADLGKALDDGDNLRVLPIISYGAVGNVSDLLYLKGVDFAITYADVLDHFKNVEKIPNIERRINYVIPMFEGELHVLARGEIRKLEDLAGKKVNFNTIGSAANYTGGIVFDRLGIKVERIYKNNAVAVEDMRKGDIAAIVHVVGKPNSLFTNMKPEPDFHFLPLQYSEKFQDYYSPTELTNADYPKLIKPGETVPTISVAALLAVYNWQTNGDRYRRVARFIEYLFDRFDRLRQPPYQPKWKDMNLAGTVPGWTRYPVAQELVDRALSKTAAQPGPRPQPEPQPAIDPVLARAQVSKVAPYSPAEQERLFQQFLEWSKQLKKN